MRTSDSGLRLAILGCGAVVELCYLPALQRLSQAPAVWIDRDEARAAHYAGLLGGIAATDVDAVLEEFDAVVVALPHHLHAPVGLALLDAGKHLLLEKPMATTPADCAALLAAAAAAGVTLAAGQVRRFVPANQWVKAALDAGLLGALRSVDVREGAVFGWPAVSDSFWRRETAGGGVLVDTGAHVLDLLHWWFGAPEAVQYQDDAMGGVEADCLASWRLPGHVEVTCELSRTRELRNTILIQGEAGSLEVGCHTGRLTASPTLLLDQTLAGHRGDRLPVPDLAGLFAAQLTNWLAAAAGREPLLCPPAEAAAAVDLLAACYAARQPWLLPWSAPHPERERSW